MDWKVEISKEELPGSKCSIYGYILVFVVFGECQYMTETMIVVKHSVPACADISNCWCTYVNLFHYGMPRETFYTILTIHLPFTRCRQEGDRWSMSAPSEQIFSHNAHGTCSFAYRCLGPKTRDIAHANEDPIRNTVWSSQYNYISEKYITSRLIQTSPRVGQVKEYFSAFGGKSS